MTTRTEQIREATTRHRKRRKRGFLWRLVTKAQLDQLEERGYLTRIKKRRLAGANRHLPVNSRPLIELLTIGGHDRQQ